MPVKVKYSLHNASLGFPCCGLTRLHPHCLDPLGCLIGCADQSFEDAAPLTHLLVAFQGLWGFHSKCKGLELFAAFYL